MIFTLTLNPSIDYHMDPLSLNYGRTNRSRQESYTYGGKGINVSVVLHRLGVDTVALGPVGGYTGEEIRRLLATEGVKTDFLPLSEGISRINVKLSGHPETEINANGPVITADERDALVRQLLEIGPGNTVVLSGSVPGSLGTGFYAKLMQPLNERRIRIVLDASGGELVRGLDKNPYLVKPNLAEAEAYIGHPLKTEREQIYAMTVMQSRGAKNVILSRGAAGALYLSEDGRLFRADGFRGHVVHTVGAGDSMLAGFLSVGDGDPREAFLMAMSAGSAAAFSAGLPDRDGIMAVYEREKANITEIK
ncbi:MAG: 1-phosphofructokinase family hexose kinase [Clostridia bacterium]|nr:1-phosphofructokinase family hexose kinase [Clostridia bacterium]